MRHSFVFIFIAALAILASCNKKNEPENSNTPQNDETSGTVKDICGNTYNYVKIGEQYWMAENMRCDKYDTQSERAGVTISTSITAIEGPYYKDASDKSLWDSNSHKSGENLTSAQIEKLGYLYSWAAAVGIATRTEALEQYKEFSEYRQGICPNGWHVPTTEEWDALGLALGGKKDNEYGWFPNIGKLLKAKSGWHENGNGTDIYSFAALPAGIAPVKAVVDMGGYAFFWTATPYSGDYAYNRTLSYDDDNLRCERDYNDIVHHKDIAKSVRCIRNDSSSTPSNSNNKSDSDESMRAVSGLDASELDNTIEQCWKVTYRGSVSGSSISEDEYVWATEKELVISLQATEQYAGDRLKCYYQTTSNSDAINSCYATEPTKIETTILRNKTYTGDYYIDDEKDDIITITFTKASDGTLEFKATLASDEPVDGPGDVLLVGTWRLDGNQLWLYITSIYGDTSLKNTGNGLVENGGNKFNITVGRSTFKNMIKK